MSKASGSVKAANCPRKTAVPPSSRRRLMTVSAFISGGYIYRYQVVEGLYAVTHDLGQIAQALRSSTSLNGVEASFTSIAYALAQGGPNGMYLSDIAKALGKAGAGFNDIATALWNQDLNPFFGDFGVGVLIGALQSAGAGFSDLLAALEGPLGYNYAGALAVLEGL